MLIDFITKLPKSKDTVTGITYNLIMVIADRFMKYLIVVLFKETGLRRLKPPRGAGWEPRGSDGRQSPKLLVVAAPRAN